MASARSWPATQKGKFKENFDIDTPIRCRAWAASAATSSTSGTVGLEVPRHPRKIYTIDDLMLPKVLKTICQEQRGLVLVTGPPAR
ncbi:MAG: hypothetical protein IPI84_15635 [Holophagaceae bacterium]|nr:hypothetical protein [Holophagaceae bacterium]